MAESRRVVVNWIPRSRNAASVKPLPGRGVVLRTYTVRRKSKRPAGAVDGVGSLSIRRESKLLVYPAPNGNQVSAEACVFGPARQSATSLVSRTVPVMGSTSRTSASLSEIAHRRVYALAPRSLLVRTVAVNSTPHAVPPHVVSLALVYTRVYRPNWPCYRLVSSRHRSGVVVTRTHGGARTIAEAALRHGRRFLVRVRVRFTDVRCQ